MALNVTFVTIEGVILVVGSWVFWGCAGHHCWPGRVDVEDDLGVGGIVCG